ncbi:hypothetical protein HYT33_01115 [Candidatus Roizmanbacteria bacterium]|nr:hypothetical protein [Candidatus Roizmanbacteria bacterium]
MFKLPLIEKGKDSASFRRGGNWDTRFVLFFFIFAVIVIFLIIVVRLFQLTIVKGDYYRRLSEENRIKKVVVEARRGTLLDRKGFVLAENTTPNLDEKGDRIRSKRTYREGEAFSHLLGYRQLADRGDLENDRCLQKLKGGDRVGKKGVEKVFECDLRGRSGQKLIELDAKGKFKKTLTVIPPQDGKTLRLAVDYDLQKKAFELLRDLPAGRQVKKGAIVALKPKTGEVLALFSSPSFQPQDFEDNNQTAMNTFLTDPDHPLFNRVTAGTYPPGSIFKLFTGSGALEDKKIDETTQFEDTGIIKAGPLTFGNWYFLEYGKTEGMVDIVKGIRRSNDIFFYYVGQRLGPERIKYWAQVFGFGKKNAFSFEQEEGLIPSPFWKAEVLKDRWYLGDTYNLSIGQGYLLVTPLQTAFATSVFANNGFLCEPKLLKDEKGNCKKLNLSKKTLELVREGMRQACAPGGTGWPLFEFKPAVACKTGTAESQDKKKGAHAWITTFAPYENPEIVVTVLVEHGGQGSDIAGPIAKELLKTYFSRSQ